MFSKRLLHKFSFILLLCLIPAVIPITNAFLSDDSGILHVVLCSKDNDAATKKAIDNLVDSDGIIRYTVSTSEEKAIEAVSTFKADAAWIFTENLSENIDEYVKGNSKNPLVRCINREESVTHQISREILYGALYSDIGYSIYKNFTLENVKPTEPLTESEIQEYYAETQRRGDIVKSEHLNSTVPPMDTNYLTAPLRGILILLIMLCTLAATLYYLKDQQEGKYDWLAPQKRLAPAFASCLSASVFSAIAVYIALQITGLSTGLLRDLVGMLLYTFCSTGFCLVLCVLFRSPGKLGATIPGLLIIMLVLSPIFFSGNQLMFIRLCLPPYYYLQSTYDNSYYLYMIYYCAGAYGLAFILNIMLNRNPRRTKLLI